MNVQGLLISGLTIGESSKLFRITKNKLNLKSEPIKFKHFFDRQTRLLDSLKIDRPIHPHSNDKQIEYINHERLTLFTIVEISLRVVACNKTPRIFYPSTRILDFSDRSHIDIKPVILLILLTLRRVPSSKLKYRVTVELAIIDTLSNRS